MNEEKKRFPWKHWSGVIVVFVVGMAIGGLVTSVLIREHVIHVMGHHGPPSLQVLITERLTKDIDLTPGQKGQIDSIASNYQSRFDDFRRSSREQIQQLVGEMEGRIREVLTPEQQPAFDRAVETMRQHRQSDERHRGGGHR